MNSGQLAHQNLAQLGWPHRARTYIYVRTQVFLGAG